MAAQSLLAVFQNGSSASQWTAPSSIQDPISNAEGWASSGDTEVKLTTLSFLALLYEPAPPHYWNN